jgi:peptidoglycan/LPS O-acetylase OafA/YrhL
LAKWPSNFSYSIYIIHYPILLICIKSGSPPIVSCIAGIVVSNLVAFLFYKVFEQHYKRFSTFLKMKLLTKKVWCFSWRSSGLFVSIFYSCLIKGFSLQSLTQSCTIQTFCVHFMLVFWNPFTKSL